MLRIQTQLIQKIYRYDLSRLTNIILLDLIQLSDEKGNVQVYYKDIVERAGCSNATFYNVICELQELGFIKCRKNDLYKSELDITILNNDFSNYDYRNGNYVDINVVLFTERYYAALSAGEIRMILYILMRIKKQGYVNSLTNELKDKKSKLLYRFNTYKTIAKEIGITVRMAKIYLKSLIKRKFINFSIHIDINSKKFDIITLSRKLLDVAKIYVTTGGTKTEDNSYLMRTNYLHFIRTLCRRYKIYLPTYDLEDIAMLMKQYRSRATQHNKNIYNVIANALEQIKNNNIFDTRILHNIVKSLIDRDYAADIVVY